VRCICNQDIERFRKSNESESFTVVDIVDLGKALSHQSCLNVEDDPICILFVLEDPLDL
jgi:hypothetical protein